MLRVKVVSLLIFFFCAHTVYGSSEESNTQLVESPGNSRIGSYAGASFIYWTPRVDGLTYAQTGRNSFETLSGGNFSDFLDLSQGKELMVNWQWEPGFKVSLGWDFRSQWQINLEYT